MRYNVYEYEGEEQPMYVTYTIEANNIQEAVKIYKDEYLDDDQISETYYSDGDPHNALVWKGSKTIDSEDYHEVTQEEWDANPHIDYMNDSRYYEINQQADITLCDEDRSFVLSDNKLHKIEKIGSFLSTQVACGFIECNPKTIPIDDEKVNQFVKCGECFK